MSGANWKPKTIWTGDNIEIMRGMNSESVDLIYLDPPFNSKRNYAAPIGSQSAGAAFKDTWSLSDIDNEWVNLIKEKHPKLHNVLLAAMTDSNKSYLIYMAARILEMHRILKSTGSIYLHCDPTMSHYLKLVMDAIFGGKNFRNEIVWCYTGPSNTMRWFPRKHDVILFYAKEDKKAFFDKDSNRIPYTKLETGKTSGIFKEPHTLKSEGKVPEDWWEEKRDGMTPVGRKSGELLGYPTQKPVKLLERIVKASSRKGDIVFDPFCGCATTCVAADTLDRQWIGIDISEKAVSLTQMRIKKSQGLWEEIIARTDIPKRTDLGKLLAPRTHKTSLYGIQAGNCLGCNEHFQIQNLEIDHIIAKSKGGTDHIDNLQLLCGNCNRVKGDRGMEYLISNLKIG